MILVRIVFQIKWGMTHQVVEAFKKSEEIMGEKYEKKR